MKAQLFAVVTFFALVFSTGSNLNAASLDTTFNAGVTNGDASISVALPVGAGKILVGGFFRYTNGSEVPYLVRLNSDGSADGTFNAGGSGLNGTVFDAVVQPDGKILIGGNFTSINGVLKKSIARLNADGSLDMTFSANISGSNPYVTKIALQSDGKVLVAGNFAVSMLRINADGTADSTFTSPFTNSLLVNDIVVKSGGGILIGGIFLEGVLGLNSDGSNDPAFSTSEQFSNVYALKLLNSGKLLIGGNFTFSGITTPPVRRLNPDGSTDKTFSAGAATGFNQTDHFEVQSDGKILIAGTFTNDGFASSGVQRLNADGGADSSFVVPTADTRSNHVSLQSDGKILLSGDFLKINGQSYPGLVRLNTDGSVDSSFSSTFYVNSGVRSIIQQPDGKVLVAGNFNFGNGSPRSNISRFNQDGTLDTAFNTGTGLGSDYAAGFKYVYKMQLQPDGKILIAGVFYGYNNHTSRGIVRLNADGTVDTGFQSELSGGLVWVYDSLLLPDGKILVSFFVTDPIFGFGNSGVVRLNSDGSIDTYFFGNDGVVRTAARQPDGKILLGGFFSGFTAITRRNTDGTDDPTFNSALSVNGSILDIVVQPDGKILIGGSFTTVGGASRNRIARLNSDGTLDTTFDPGSGANTTVWKLKLDQSERVIIGGNFSSYNGVNRNRMARLNSNGSLDSTFDSGLDSAATNSVQALDFQSDGKLLVGGSFSSYGGVARNSVARLNLAPQSSTKFDFDGDRKTDISIFRPSVGQWWYLRSSDLDNRAFAFGNALDTLVPADYTGDGKTDIAFFRPSTNEWFVLRSEDSAFFSFQFGAAGDIPAPGDFDGDGKADSAVFRPSTGTWYINKSSGGTTIQTFGAPGDKPVVSDYDGDGKDDIAIYRPSVSEWWINRSTAGLMALKFGASGDLTTPGDFTGDGKSDVAFYRPSSGMWFILRSEDNLFFAFPFGTNGDIPTPGDYDGDGKQDAAIFRPSSNTWYVNGSTSGVQIVGFGASGDAAVPNAYVRN